MSAEKATTILIVPGLRDHVAEHWQTLLQQKLPHARAVPPLTQDKLNCQARVDALARELDAIDGPVIIVAHSAGAMMVAHWALRGTRPIKGALLVTPPDLEQPMPAPYPEVATLEANGWLPIPQLPLRFPSIVIASGNDPLASPARVALMAKAWNSTVFNIGNVGHLNPAAGYGEWPQAEQFIRMLDE